MPTRAPGRCGRTSACWRSGSGRSTTDEYGKGAIEVKLPESLTTYRIMAVAADRASRFGSSDAEVRINKPLTLKPTFPRFLALGDKAYFGAVVTSQLKTAGAATVTIASLDPDVLEFTAGARADAAGRRRRVDRGAVRRGRQAGRPRARAMTVKIGDETDAFEDVIPVELLVSPETVAAYGEATDAQRDRNRNADDSGERRARALAACTSSCRRRRWSDSAKARGTSSSIPTAAPSSADRARSRSCWPPTSATRSRCRAWTRRRCVRRRSRT